MTRLYEPTRKEQRAWDRWVASRPEVVRKVAERFDPWSLYLLKTTGHRVTLYSFSEDGTVTVNITGEHNQLAFDRQVFGISPDDLEPCRLPRAGEPVGTLMSQEEVNKNIDVLRAVVRPDLFVLDIDGKIRRKQ